MDEKKKGRQGLRGRLGLKGLQGTKGNLIVRFLIDLVDVLYLLDLHPYDLLLSSHIRLQHLRYRNRSIHLLIDFQDRNQNPGARDARIIERVDECLLPVIRLVLDVQAAGLKIDGIDEPGEGEIQFVLVL